MKKCLSLICVVGLAIAVTAAPRLTRGFGKEATATTTAQEVAFVEDTQPCLAYSVSILNKSTNTVYCAVNTSLSAFTNMVAMGQAIPVIKNASFAFTDTKVNLGSIWIVTTNGTANVCIGAY